MKMFRKGLKGVVAVETKVASVDGEKGRLTYRGYDVGELTKTLTFEEAASLLWYGELPTDREVKKCIQKIKDNRALSPLQWEVLQALPRDMSLMDVIRTLISLEGDQTYSGPPTVEQAIKLTAVIPTIIAHRTRLLANKDVVHPELQLSHVENYLYMLTGKKPLIAHVQALETYMILTMEHGMNASTFAARVTASTESDIVSSIVTAIGTMKGPLHGGAPTGVIALLEELKVSNDRKKTIKHKILSGEKLMGFGHRVYKTVDPRAEALKEKLLSMQVEDSWLHFAIEVEKEVVTILAELKPDRKLYTNVEFYATAIMRALSMDPTLFTPTFTAARMVGWTAHILEQAEDNVIFRPQSTYVGSEK